MLALGTHVVISLEKADDSSKILRSLYVDGQIMSGKHESHQGPIRIVFTWPASRHDGIIIFMKKNSLSNKRSNFKRDPRFMDNIFCWHVKQGFLRTHTSKLIAKQKKTVTLS